MMLPSDPCDLDHWPEEAGPGVLAEWHFAGAEGLSRLGGPQSFTAPDPAGFRASLIRVQLDHVALEHLVATPHSSERSAAHIAAFPTPLLTVVFLLEGTLTVHLDELDFTVGPDQCVVLDSRHPVTLHAPDGVRLARAVVGVEHVPAALQREDATVPGPVPRTALLDSYAAFVLSLLHSARDGQRPVGVELIASVAELQAAALAEAQQVVDHPLGPAALRYRIEQFIDAHHADPRLDVEGIAHGVQTSVRNAHLVFDDGERTLGRALRARRVNAAAQALRSAAPLPNLQQLALDSGFSDRDVLARAFEQHFGMTVRDYHAGGHRNFG